VAKLLARFLRERQGVVAIEFAFLIPILLVILCTTVVVYLLFESSKVTERATYTVGDIVSRRTTVDSTFLNSTYQLFLKMTDRQAADVQFRISSLKKQSGAFTVTWSYAVAPQTALSTGAIPTTSLPMVTDGDSVLLVETVANPPSITSFLPITVPSYNNRESVRPRFTSAITKSD
jgi:Flp pilus assembly protein TadG